jgi:hypothetical protein
MTLQRSVLIAFALTAASAAVGAWAYVVLPPGAFLAYHQTFGGPASGHLDKAHALALMPCIVALVSPASPWRHGARTMRAWNVRSHLMGC